MKLADELRRRLAKPLPRKYRDAVADYRIELGQDASGAEAVWVWIVLRDDRAHAVWQGRERWRDLVREAMAEIAPGRWAYVRFSAESEATNPEIPPARN